MFANQLYVMALEEAFRGMKSKESGHIMHCGLDASPACLAGVPESNFPWHFALQPSGLRHLSLMV